MRPPPPLLYKYLPCDRIDVLKNKHIRFTQRSDLNDIFELSPRVEFDDAAYHATRKKMILQEPQSAFVPPSTAEDDEKIIREIYDDEVLVLSLSCRWDLIPMWAHYADCGRGFVVGFSTSSPLLEGVQPVVYDAVPEVVRLNLEKAIFKKFSQWGYEEEWRCYRVMSEQPADDIKDDRYHLYKFDVPVVREVILGPRSPAKFRCDVADVISQYENATLFQAFDITGSFDLHRRPLNG